VTIGVYVDDVDTTFDAAVKAGATSYRALENQFYGDRSVSSEDPFGHRWNVATHVEDRHAPIESVSTPPICGRPLRPISSGARVVFDVRRDVPPVAERVLELTGPVAVELVLERAIRRGPALTAASKGRVRRRRRTRRWSRGCRRSSSAPGSPCRGAPSASMITESPICMLGVADLAVGPANCACAPWLRAPVL